MSSLDGHGLPLLKVHDACSTRGAVHFNDSFAEISPQNQEVFGQTKLRVKPIG